MSFSSQLEPELPQGGVGLGGGVQSCQRISAYCHYLFKSSSDTLAAPAFMREEGGKGKCHEVAVERPTITLHELE